MKCKKCGSEQLVKNGKVNGGKQRYRCKMCSCRSTDTPIRGVGEKVKTGALHLYLEGLGFRSIARFFNVSNVAVLKWIRAFGANIEIEKPGYVEFMELDEMHHYIAKKKLGSAGSGWLLIEIPAMLSGSKSGVVVLTRHESSGTRLKA